MSDKRADAASELMELVKEILFSEIKGVVVPLYHMDFGLNPQSGLAIEGTMTKAFDDLDAEKQKTFREMVDVGSAGFVKALREAGLVEGIETVRGSDVLRAQDFASAPVPEASKEDANADEANAAASSAK